MGEAFRRNCPPLELGVIVIHVWSVRGTKREFAWRFFKEGRVVYAPSVLAFFFVHATPSARHKFAGGTKRNETQEGAHRALCLASRDNINEPISPPFLHPFSTLFWKRRGAKVIVSFFLDLLSLLYVSLFWPSSSLFGPLFLAPWRIFSFLKRMTLARNDVPRAF